MHPVKDIFDHFIMICDGEGCLLCNFCIFLPLCPHQLQSATGRGSSAVRTASVSTAARCVTM